MIKSGTVIVRTDADSIIGIGHLTRCLTLLKQLRKDGFSTGIIGRKRFGTRIEQIVGDIPTFWIENNESIHDEKSELINETLDADKTLDIIGRNPDGISWVIVDHYKLGEEWERKISCAGHKVLAIDDYRDRSHFADILVSDTNKPFNTAYNRKSKNVLELVGEKYSLVDADFAFSEQLNSHVKKRILISYGGSDFTGETIKALEAISYLRKYKPWCELIGPVHVVIGHANDRADDVIRLAGEIENVFINTAAKSLAPLMRKADLFLTAAGNTLVEALTMRLPCIVTRTSSNQSLMVDQLVKHNVIYSLGFYKDADSKKIVKAIIESVAEYEHFHQSVKKKAIFDHLGAVRISCAIQAESNKLINH